MDNTRRLIRWAIPGGLLLLFAVSSILLVQNLPGTARHQEQDLWATLLSPKLSGSLLGAALGAAILIGFLLNQVYYSLYRPSYMGNRAVTFDRGNAVLSELPPSALFPELGCPKTPYLQGWLFTRLAPDPGAMASHMRSWHVSWHQVRGLVNYVCQFDGREYLRLAFERHNDLFHSLGSARLAVLLAIPIHLIIIRAYASEEELNLILIWITISSGCVMLALVWRWMWWRMDHTKARPHRRLFVGALIASALLFELYLHAAYGAGFAVDEAIRFFSDSPIRASHDVALVHRVQVEVGVVYLFASIAYALHCARARTCKLLVNVAREGLGYWIRDVGTKRAKALADRGFTIAHLPLGQPREG